LKNFKLTYKTYGERSILIEWPEEISTEILADIVSFRTLLEKKYNKQNIHVNSAYSSLLISYTNLISDFRNQIIELKELYDSNDRSYKTTSKLWKIPVCYDEQFGKDLSELSAELNISNEELIKVHSKTLYDVYFIGFLPGFLYLGGLNKQIQFPRKAKPRQKINKGDVAIGGKQTGIYSIDSPGGWNIIGNTPVSLFDVTQDRPCFAKSGDKIQFFSVPIEEYRVIKNSNYLIESEVLHD
jgi:inhibitor of KinA